MSIPNGGNQKIAKGGNSKDTSTNSNGQDSNDTLNLEQAKTILAEAQKVKADLERRLYEDDKRKALEDPTHLDTIDSERANKIVKSITDKKYKNVEEYKQSLSMEEIYSEIEDPTVLSLRKELDEMKKNLKDKELSTKQVAWQKSLEEFKQAHAEFNDTNDVNGSNTKELMNAVEKLKAGDDYKVMLEDAYALVQQKLNIEISMPTGGFSVGSGITTGNNKSHIMVDTSLPPNFR